MDDAKKVATKKIKRRIIEILLAVLGKLVLLVIV